MKKKKKDLLPIFEATDFKINEMNKIPSGKHYCVLVYDFWEQNPNNIKSVSQFCFTNKIDMEPFVKWLSLNKRQFVFFEVQGLGQFETQLKFIFP